jgi:hypothetical protein
MNKQEIAEEADRFVRDEVLVCLSSLIGGIKDTDELAEELGFDTDALWQVESSVEEVVREHLDSLDRSELIAASEYFDVGVSAAAASLCPIELVRLNILSVLEVEDAWEDALRYFGLECPDREVYEHWAVTPRAANKLRFYGEQVIDAFGLHIWCRTTTGQSISMDDVIQRIVSEKECVS